MCPSLEADTHSVIYSNKIIQARTQNIKTVKDKQLLNKVC